MTSKDRALLLRNAFRTTGLLGLEALEHDCEIDAILDQVVNEQNTDKDTERQVRANMECLIRGVATSLRWRAWGPSRSESLRSGPPPAPHLVDLLEE